MDFSERLHNLRKHRGMTQTELAEKAGCTPRAIHNYETGERIPKGQFLDKLANGLGVPKQALLSDDEYAKFLSQLNGKSMENIINSEQKNILLLNNAEKRVIMKQAPSIFKLLLLSPPIALSSLIISGSIVSAYTLYQKNKKHDDVLKEIYKEKSRVAGLIVYLNEKIEAYRENYEQLAVLTQQDDADIDDYKKFIQISQIMSDLQEYHKLLKLKSKYCSLLISEIEENCSKTTDVLEKILSEIKEIEENERRLISTLKIEDTLEL